jgi:hypothetical protein
MGKISRINVMGWSFNDIITAESADKVKQSVFQTCYQIQKLKIKTDSNKTITCVRFVSTPNGKNLTSALCDIP